MITDRTLYAYEQFCEEYLNYNASAGKNKIRNRYRRKRKKGLPTTINEFGVLTVKIDPEYRPLSLHDKWRIDSEQLTRLARMQEKERKEANDLADLADSRTDRK